MPALLDKPDRWRKRAEEIRTIADGMNDPKAKSTMLRLAESYDELAKRAEDRSRVAAETMAIEIRILHAGDENILNNVASGVFDHQVDKELAAEFLRDPRHHLCVALENNMVVAFASALHYVHPDKPAQLWINEIGVSPSHQRKGFAKAILDALLSLGRELGCTEAWVLTDEENAAARSLYKSAGGVEVTQVMASFQLPHLSSVSA
jgi:ribosomal protein S18 acetylase RimI-like enzyme